MELSIPVNLTPSSYSKIVCHALKYPSQEINGVLLGEAKEGDEVIDVIDAIPLFHGPTLAPMLEVAMMMIDEYCELKELKIVGYYHGNERDDSEPSPLAKKIANKIHSNVPLMTVLMIENVFLSPKFKRAALRSYLKEGEQWKANGENVQVGGNAFNLVQTCIDEHRYLSLADFDNHFNDPANDWLNPKF
eukprot:TRINITY_DN8799_c0_g1_i1.p1 TRINITY_DN8799_c0_g1~~TRINITY_DN8799_c0_g1_i1.p1  ORF type:complete len:190 (-),score=53.28 TRINITY_DN8799_c0_g1_i1:52-621(-)